MKHMCCDFFLLPSSCGEEIHTRTREVQVSISLFLSSYILIGDKNVARLPPAPEIIIGSM